MGWERSEMSLSRVYSTDRETQCDPWPESQPWRPRLRTLLVSDIRNLFCRCFIHPQIDLTSVKSLTLTTDSNRRREEMIQATNGGVEYLRLQYRWYQYYCKTLDFPKSIFGANLRFLHIAGPIFGSMHTFFTTVSDYSRLESIIFQECEIKNPVLDRPSLDSTVDSAMIHLPCLKAVEIQICLLLTSNRSEPLSKCVAAVQAALPSLVERGLLRVTAFEVEDISECGFE
ncbi:hypothetical protein B0H14DRAFT_1171557 [Mycena olivaceomarginata]|nr:hypothetical protein B0H14DRAFT_1171557 [Mycena olivaceomarginata]